MVAKGNKKRTLQRPCQTSTADPRQKSWWQGDGSLTGSSSGVCGFHDLLSLFDANCWFIHTFSMLFLSFFIQML
jgi:hypothetical protein